MRAQLLHIYRHGVRPSDAAAAPLELALSLYPAPRAEAYEPVVSEAERRFRLRTFGRARGADRVKEEECLRADEEFRVEGLVARLEDAAAAAAPEEPESVAAPAPTNNPHAARFKALFGAGYDVDNLPEAIEDEEDSDDDFI